MIAQNTPTKFTLLQLEMLRLFGREVTEEDLIAIKDMIGKYFMQKLQDKVDISVRKNGYNEDDFVSWLNDSGQ